MVSLVGPRKGSDDDLLHSSRPPYFGAKNELVSMVSYCSLDMCWALDCFIWFCACRGGGRGGGRGGEVLRPVTPYKC